MHPNLFKRILFSLLMSSILVYLVFRHNSTDMWRPSDIQQFINGTKLELRNSGKVFRQEIELLKAGMADMGKTLHQIPHIWQELGTKLGKDIQQITIGLNNNITQSLREIRELNRRIKVSQNQTQFKTKLDELVDRVENMQGKWTIFDDVLNKRNDVIVRPKWIEQFNAAHWSEFKPWRGVFVIFITYRPEYLESCLQSIQNVTQDIHNESLCIFALDEAYTDKQKASVNKTMALIRNVSFCRVFVWHVNSNQYLPREVHKDRQLRFKYHWWFVLGSLFNATMDEDDKVFHNSLHNYKEDILFIEEDAVLAPDFVKVNWFLNSIKNRNPGILQTSLGGWSGENMINAHPDTFIVRVTRELRAVVYGFNRTTWRHFKSLERDFFADKQNDWCNSMGYVLAKHNNLKGTHIVVPTLSRVWHIGKWGLGLGGDFQWARPVTKQPNWAHASRLVDLTRARVNAGVRDMLGFLCQNRTQFYLLKDTICPGAVKRWHGLQRNRILCAKQPFVDDLCDVYV